MIVVATNEERQFVEQRYKGKHIIETGVGAINVFNALKDVNRETPIINLGFVGSPNLAKGSVVSVGEVQLYHPNVDYKEPSFKLTGNVKCYSSCDFVLEAKERNCVFDMELAFILAMGFTNVRSYKKVSDNLNLKEYKQSTTINCLISG